MLWIRQVILNSLAASAIFCMTVATPRSLFAQTSANQGQLTSLRRGFSSLALSELRVLS